MTRSDAGGHRAIDPINTLKLTRIRSITVSMNLRDPGIVATTTLLNRSM